MGKNDFQKKEWRQKMNEQNKGINPDEFTDEDVRRVGMENTGQAQGKRMGSGDVRSLKAQPDGQQNQNSIAYRDGAIPMPDRSQGQIDPDKSGSSEDNLDKRSTRKSGSNPLTGERPEVESDRQQSPISE